MSDDLGPEYPRFDRTTALTALAGRRFDVLVVGGGITGAGVALDAASRGLSTALVERDDFASGTSSASSKLIHGLMAADRSLGEPLVEGLPYLRAEVVHTVRHEMARTLGDVLDRRLRARILDRDGAAGAASDVAALVGPELGWSRVEADANVAEYRRSLDEERVHAGLLADDGRLHRSAG